LLHGITVVATTSKIGTNFEPNSDFTSKNFTGITIVVAKLLVDKLYALLFSKALHNY